METSLLSDAAAEVVLHVNRLVQEYPEGFRPLHPELERLGPYDYRLGQLKPWWHGDQSVDGGVRGSVIHLHLLQQAKLRLCVGLMDLREFERQGPEFLKRRLAGLTVPAWKSTCETSSGLLVPCLSEDGISWEDIDRMRFHDRNPTLMF